MSSSVVRKKDINFNFSTCQSFNEEISHDNYINFKKRFLQMESIVILKVRISVFLSFVHTLSHYGLLTVICFKSDFGKLTENVLFE